jgi:hypothetical protein
MLQVHARGVAAATASSIAKSKAWNRSNDSVIKNRSNNG